MERSTITIEKGFFPIHLTFDRARMRLLSTLLRFLRLSSSLPRGRIHLIIGDPKGIVKALIDRENLGSTGIGQGIAIPHGKTDKVKRLTAVLGISKNGVNFDALDGEPVYIFVLLVAPKATAGPHLKALAQISRLLRDSYFCELLRKCRTEDEVFNMIKTEEDKKH